MDTYFFHIFPFFLLSFYGFVCFLCNLAALTMVFKSLSWCRHPRRLQQQTIASPLLKTSLYCSEAVLLQLLSSEASRTGLPSVATLLSLPLFSLGLSLPSKANFKLSTSTTPLTFGGRLSMALNTVTIRFDYPYRFLRRWPPLINVLARIMEPLERPAVRRKPLMSSVQRSVRSPLVR